MSNTSIAMLLPTTLKSYRQRLCCSYPIPEHPFAQELFAPAGHALHQQEASLFLHNLKQLGIFSTLRLLCRLTLSCISSEANQFQDLYTHEESLEYPRPRNHIRLIQNLWNTTNQKFLQPLKEKTYSWRHVKSFIPGKAIGGLS